VDDKTTPMKQEFTSLPWTLTITTKLNAMFAEVVAEGDSPYLRCQIIVNGEVRDDETSNNTNASVSCLVKSA
jgi:hypothetical protein